MTATPATSIGIGPSQDVVEAIVIKASDHSDMDLRRLHNLAAWFIRAHEQAPGGVSIEVGTRRGGSAWLCLRLLQHMYPPGAVPMLFTVDPYGDKPYHGGDVTLHAAYGDYDYFLAKRLLAPFTSHAHFHLMGETFFHALGGHAFWWRGVKQRFDGFTFVLLDGDHDALTVLAEVEHACVRLAPGGIVFVDDIDKDPRLAQLLQQPVPARCRIQETNVPTQIVFVKEPT